MHPNGCLFGVSCGSIGEWCELLLVWGIYTSIHRGDIETYCNKYKLSSLPHLTLTAIVGVNCEKNRVWIEPRLFQRAADEETRWNRTGSYHKRGIFSNSEWHSLCCCCKQNMTFGTLQPLMADVGKMDILETVIRDWCGNHQPQWDKLQSNICEQSSCVHNNNNNNNNNNNE